MNLKSTQLSLCFRATFLLTSLLIAAGCSDQMGAIGNSSDSTPVTSPITAETPAANADATPSSSANDSGDTDDDSDEVAIAANVSSCLEILKANPKSKSGQYRIRLGNAKKSVKVLCDMESDGGGWTVILDGIHPSRKRLTRYFDNADAKLVPDTNFAHDKEKGLFWTANQYFIAKNMPKNSEIRVVFSVSYKDPVYGANCYAILGLLSPEGWNISNAASFTAFVQKNETSDWIKATYNDQSFAVFQNVQTNAVARYPYSFTDGSRLFAGNPYGFGNTCHTFFFNKVMVR